MKKIDRVFVDPKFKLKLKVLSAERGMSIMEFTKCLAKDDDFETEFKKQKVKRGGFNIGL